MLKKYAIEVNRFGLLCVVKREHTTANDDRI